MIRFACPRCKAVQEQPEQAAGTKLACPNCGQRLQVPQPPEAKTMLGSLVGKQGGRSSEAEIKTVNGREHLYWHCPLCQNQVDVPIDLSQTTIRCPHCTQKIAVPGIQTTADRVPTSPSVPPPPPDVLAPYVTAKVEPQLASPPPLRTALDPPPPPVFRRGRRAADFDDDDFEEEFSSRRGGHYSRHAAAKSALSGMVCSLIALGLLLVTVFIWALGSRHGHDFRDAGSAMLLMTFISLSSFIMGLMGTIFSSRGMSEENNRNRGVAISGLVCGIIALVVGAVFLFFFLFCGLFLWNLPH